jgi:hypothetical protein
VFASGVRLLRTTQPKRKAYLPIRVDSMDRNKKTDQS